MTKRDKDLSDEELACQTQAGSLSAFEELVYRYEARIFEFPHTEARIFDLPRTEARTIDLPHTRRSMTLLSAADYNAHPSPLLKTTRRALGRFSQHPEPGPESTSRSCSAA